MEREITGKLLKWKDSKLRKPLILTGVRQCGKTYILTEFGKKNFRNVVYLNFEADSALGSVFDYNYDIDRILREISLINHTTITPGETLLILDEIQECPRAITSLKYFCENKRELHVACAGSLLGIALKNGNVSFPVGKVNRLQMFPLSFKEFVIASGEGTTLEVLADWPGDRPIPESYAALMVRLFKEYYSVGGMPEAVLEWHDSHDIEVVEEIQDEILKGYADDFSKHAPLNQVEKIRWIWDSIPIQLSKENNKFVFSHVRAGKRAAELEDALQWLNDSGLVAILELVEQIESPLSSVADATYFKVYFSDLGLLRRKAGLSHKTILDEDAMFMRFKGALAENYVLNELLVQGYKAYFWRSGNSAEVDILTEYDNAIIPMEVKSSDNVKAKSLQQYCKRYAPKVAYKLSLKNIGESDYEQTRIVSLPLYLTWNWKYYLDR